jgi:hypothetical protein
VGYVPSAARFDPGTGLEPSAVKLLCNSNIMFLAGTVSDPYT